MAFTVVDGWTVPGFTHERELGDGPTGRVVLAVDDLTGTHVVIKYLAEALRADEAFLARFREAARNLSQIEDPNVVDLYDFVETADGAAIVMQRAEGVGLRRVLAAQGPTGPLAALSMLGGTLLGLHAAHEKDVVHGALRPANIMVDEKGNALLTDFATAPAGAGVRFGAQYAAPELWDGAPAAVVTDLYAATAVFYECLTGRPPYAGRNMARLHREAPVPAEEVPGPLRDLIHKGLAKDPGERPGSAADFLILLEEAAISAYGPSWEAQGRGRLAELAAQAANAPEPPKPKPARGSGRNPVVAGKPGGGGRGRWILAAAAVLVIAAGGAGAAAFLHKDEPAAEPPAAGPEPTPAQSSSPQPSLPAGGVDPAPLIAQVEQATARAGAASFSYRQSGCCGFPVSGKGTLELVQGQLPSLSMTLAGAGSIRKPAHTIVIHDKVYVRPGKKWHTAAVGGRGYPGAADQVRQGGSVDNITALLRSATKLTRSGAVYEGEAPTDALAQAPGVGPLYTRMAQATGVRQVTFAVKFDSAHRPVKFWVRAENDNGRKQMQNGSFAKWGTKPNIKEPGR